MLSPLQTSATMIDDRTLRAYLRNNAAWNLDESAPGPPMMDPSNLSSSGNGDKFLNSSVHLPAEMRSANLNEMVSNIVDENCEFYPNGMLPAFSPSMIMPFAWSNGGQTDQAMQHMKSMPSRYSRYPSSTLSESGHPRNIPDSCSIRPNAPKDIQVVVRKGDHNGITSLVTSMSLQQFRQMLGLQCSTGMMNTTDRRIPPLTRSSDTRRPYSSMNTNQPLSSSSSSSSSSLTTSNIRLANGLKQQRTQETMLTQNYSSLPISSHETLSMNFPGANGNSTINDPNLTSPVTTCQDISYFRSNRRTGVANTLHIAIEKCYEQLNYIRDSYAETESKIGIQTLHKSPSSPLINDITNSNFSTLSNNPSRVDRLIAEYHNEHNRVFRLHERIKEGFTPQDIESTRQTLDEWLNAINNVQDRRRQEIDNAAEKCRSGEPRLPDEKDVLQLAEALRVLRITTRKIRTVLWYWLYWSTNSTTNKIPLIARHHDQLINDDEQQKFILKNSNENNKENECND